ncbi:MAG: hypothetical protein AB7S44_01970 [Spirochaetales bacterium]
MEKTAYLQNEIDLIKNERIKDFLIGAINDVPDYFFKAPASSSGKFHPQYALGEGGLLRHTKAATKFLNHLLTMEHNRVHFTEDERDLALCAIILHDTRKSGDTCEKTVEAVDSTTKEVYESKTLPNHPKLAALAIVANTDNYKKLTHKEGSFMLKGILSHMGEWNTDRNNNNKVILPKPTSLLQQLVHTADFLASRKDLSVDLSNDKMAYPQTEEVEPTK